MLPTWVSLLVLIFCVSVASTPEGEKKELCRKPRCVWINSLLRNGELSVSGELSILDDGKAFCHEGAELNSLDGLSKLWTTLRVSVVMTPTDGLIIGRGNSSAAALSSDESPTRQTKSGAHFLYLSTHGVDCVGLIPESVDRVEYTLSVKKTIAYESLLLLSVGIILVFTAPFLSRSVTLFYGAGITIGVVASVLILLYMFSKFVPKKTSIVGLGILTGGYTLFASFFYWFWNHALEVALSNWQYITAYVAIAALVSFAVLYRMAPPTNQRTLDIIQWTIQLVGVACVYLAFPIKEVGVASVMLTVLLYNISTSWVLFFLSPFFLLYRLLTWILSPFACLLAPFSCILNPLFHCLSLLNPRRWFQPTHRLLTQQEYEEEGRVETKKALEEMRKYCRRRDDQIWDKISNLHDSKRFTSFLAGKAHITAQEQVDYEWHDGGLDSTSESENESLTNRDNISSQHTAHNSPHRSPSSSRSSLSRSMNSSSDSPTFTRTHHHTSHHLTSTPRTRTPHSHH